MTTTAHQGRKESEVGSTQRIIYQMAYPYGAPTLILRGGATKSQDVKDAIKAYGGQWDGQRHGWKIYVYADEAAVILRNLRDQFDMEIIVKDDSEIVDLDTPSEISK